MPKLPSLKDIVHGDVKPNNILVHMAGIALRESKER